MHPLARTWEVGRKKKDSATFFGGEGGHAV